MAEVLFLGNNKVRNGNVNKRDNKMNRVHSSHRTVEWQPCPLQLQPLFTFLQLPLPVSVSAIAVLFTSSPSTALPFTNTSMQMQMQVSCVNLAMEKAVGLVLVNGLYLPFVQVLLRWLTVLCLNMEEARGLLGNLTRDASGFSQLITHDPSTDITFLNLDLKIAI
ncbi:hypothetical protein E2542_SST03376 [Spatholobus suberectus]|nr:hypothetical protein E2542_SST03376 [Spatholobus suberectus]